MSNPVFPTVKTPASVIPDYEDRGMASEMDDGSISSRPRFTRSRKTFTTQYTALSYAEMESIMDFYDKYAAGIGNIIDWVNPDPRSKFHGQTFHVRIIQKPDPQYVPPKYWN
jgi:hypothetical protein